MSTMEVVQLWDSAWIQGHDAGRFELRGLPSDKHRVTREYRDWRDNAPIVLRCVLDGAWKMGYVRGAGRERKTRNHVQG